MDSTGMNCRNLNKHPYTLSRKCIEGNLGLDKRARIDLGLELLSSLILPNNHLTCDDIALWCGCTDAAISYIERKALDKLRQELDKLGVKSI